MSDFPVRQAPDRIATRPIVIVAVVGVLVTVSSAIIPAWILERRGEIHLEGPQREASAPVAPREIDLLEQTLLESQDAVASSTKAAQRAHLERYGLLEREPGLVHIPIERAMELVVRAQARDRAASEGGAP